MSPRSFARRFRQETGTTPAQWVSDQRTRVAQSLLETTDLPVEHVAVRTGFGSATTLRTHFGRRLATTPTAYRRALRERRPGRAVRGRGVGPPPPPRRPPRARRMEGGPRPAGHHAGGVGDLMDDRNPPADPLGRVDDDRRRR